MIHERSHFIITGTSSGIGLELAKLMLEHGSHVYGVSRRQPEQLMKKTHYRHFAFDLCHTHLLDNLMCEIFESVNLASTDFIGLIHNASMLEPLQSVKNCTSEEIVQNINIGLIAPISMTAQFMRLTQHLDIRRKIVMISSGSGSYPTPDMSLYSAAKAGLNMFTQCVGLEQSHSSKPIEIIGVIPGMVDTEMQAAAREKEDSQFKMARYFREAHASGQLLSAQNAGERLLEIIHQRYDSGKLVDINEG